MKLGFRSKIYSGIFSLLLLLGFVVFILVSRIMKDALREEHRSRGISIGINLAARVDEPILAMDFLRMKTLVDETLQLSGDIFYAFVLDGSGIPLVHTFKGGFPIELKAANAVEDSQSFHIQLLDTGKERVYDFAVPIMIGDDRFGTARVGILQTGVQEAIDRLRWSTLLATAFVVLLAGFVSTALAGTVTRRIKVLHDSSEQAMRGNLDSQTSLPLKKYCWDIMNCNKQSCSAYGDIHQRCWYIAGTLCPNCTEGEYAKKIINCYQCPVYRKCSGDEIQSLAESFDSMTRSLKNHITELEHTEKSLNAQQKLLKTILDATPDIVSLQDNQLVFRAVNKAFCNLIAQSEEHIIGKTDGDLFPGEVAEKYREEKLEVIDTGLPLEGQEPLETSDGKHWFHIMKIPVRGPDGQINGVLCSGRDITELKEIQARLIQSQKMDSIGQLAAGIAHEINTPLGIILGYAQVLEEEFPKDSMSHKDLKVIEKQSKICRKIVSDLLKFSRHTGSTETSVDIEKTVDEVLSVIEHPYRLNRIEIIRDYGSNMPMVRGDREKLKQVFLNLFNNAHDAIGSNGTICVQSGFGSRNNEIFIAFGDTGVGIPPDKIDRIFDPFFTTKSVGDGTGLGLSVTLGIIQEIGGRIEVFSPPPSDYECKAEGINTLFSIYLPIVINSINEEAVDGKNSGT